MSNIIGNGINDTAAAARGLERGHQSCSSKRRQARLPHLRARLYHPVSLRSFRLRFQTAFPGNVSLFNLDGGILPAGNFSQWDQGTLTPLATVIRLSIRAWLTSSARRTEGRVREPGHQNAGGCRGYRWREPGPVSCSRRVTAKWPGRSTYTGGGANPIILTSQPMGRTPGVAGPAGTGDV